MDKGWRELGVEQSRKGIIGVWCSWKQCQFNQHASVLLIFEVMLLKLFVWVNVCECGIEIEYLVNLFIVYKL